MPQLQTPTNQVLADSGDSFTPLTPEESAYLNPPVISFPEAPTSIEENLSAYHPVYQDSTPAVKAADAYEWHIIPQWLKGLSGPDNIASHTERVQNRADADITGQSGECSWWNVSCKTAHAAAATGDFIKSTLYKVIIIMVLIGIGFVFVSSYVKKKGEKLA